MQPNHDNHTSQTLNTFNKANKMENGWLLFGIMEKIGEWNGMEMKMSLEI